MSRREVMIVGAHGRGLWLATELAQKGLTTSYIDVSSQLGPWAPEDWEGPFGVFREEQMPSSQWARLSEEDYLEEQQEGFTVWPSTGPLDMRGWLTPYWQESLPEVKVLNDHLQSWEAQDQKAKSSWSFELEGEPFHDTWLALLVYHLASPQFGLNAEGLLNVMPLSCFSPFFIRQVTRKGLSKSFEWARSQGVEVVEGAQLIDCGFEGRKMVSLEVRKEVTQALSAERFIFAIGQAELVHIWSRAKEVSGWQTHPHPQWVWMRWRFNQSHQETSLKSIPRHVVMIENISLPWAYSNMVILQKCAHDQQLDGWMRIPFHRRFQKAFHEEVIGEVIQTLNRRIPKSNWQVLEYPQESNYSSSQLGPALFPVWSREDHRRLKSPSWQGVNWCGQDTWANLSWGGRFLAESAVLTDLLQWKEQKTIAEQKQQKGSHDRTIHSP